jgi:hypothetical protein
MVNGVSDCEKAALGVLFTAKSQSFFKDFPVTLPGVFQILFMTFMDEDEPVFIFFQLLGVILNSSRSFTQTEGLAALIPVNSHCHNAISSLAARACFFYLSALMKAPLSPYRQIKKRLDGAFYCIYLRRLRDSNPRYGYPYTNFPGLLLQPLGQVSLIRKRQIYVFNFIFGNANRP